MVSEKKKDFLAIINGLERERYVDCVNEQGKQKYTAEEENARLRNAVKLLIDLITINHPNVLYTNEYKELMEYYNDFEEIKQATKDRLNIN